MLSQIDAAMMRARTREEVSMPAGQSPITQDPNVVQDGRTTRQRRLRPVVMVNTGEGKGKTTAAMGTALRAWNHGWDVGVFQFVKSGRWHVGEQDALQALGRTALAWALGSLFGPAAAQGPVLQRWPGGAYPFTLGVASGEPLPGSVVLWTRLLPNPRELQPALPPQPIEVRWELARDERFRDIVAHYVREHDVPVAQLHPEHRVRKGLDDRSLDLDDSVLLSHVPPSVLSRSSSPRRRRRRAAAVAVAQAHRGRVPVARVVNAV